MSTLAILLMIAAKMKPDYLSLKQAVLLDMNSTFMFGEDRFGDTEDYSIAYQEVGGGFSPEYVNQLIRDAYNYLAPLYPDPDFRDVFPSVRQALERVANEPLCVEEIERLITVFAMHEIGGIPPQHLDALWQLKSHFRLGLVIDIWSSSKLWRDYFLELGILDWFEAISFSSDHGSVKPSPYGFQTVLDQMGLRSEQAIFIGDSVRRDLGGANAAGLDCVLVGGATSGLAKAVYPDLLALTQQWCSG